MWRGCKLAILGSAAVFVGSSSGCGLPGVAISEDLSDFDEVRLEHEPIFGYCLSPDMPFSASIRPTAPESFTVELSMLGQPTEDCRAQEHILVNSPDFPCLPVTDFPARAMTEDEIQEMRTVFSRLQLAAVLFPCFPMVVDPCTVTRFHWDDVTHSTFWCDPFHLTEAQGEALFSFLESLATE